MTRVLRVSPGSNGDKFRSVYEKPGQGWVQKLVNRASVPLVDTKQLVDHLNEQNDSEDTWKTGGPNGLVGICSIDDLPETPERVARRLGVVEHTCEKSLLRSTISSDHQSAG